MSCSETQLGFLFSIWLTHPLSLETAERIVVIRVCKDLLGLS